MKANQTVIKNGSSKWMTAGMCFGISVVLHVVIAMMICLRIIMLESEVVVIKPKEAKKDEIIVSIQLDPIKPAPVVKPSLTPLENSPLTPEELKALALKPAPVEPPKPLSNPKDLKKHVRTTDDQLSGKVPETNLEGERDTIAASNTSPVAGAPDRISIQGEEPKIKDHIETVDTVFQDGELEHMSKGGEVAETQPEARITPPSEVLPDPKKVAEIDQKEKNSSVDPTKELDDALDEGKLATTSKESKKFLETEKKIALSEELPTAKKTGAKENEGLEEKKKTIANNQPDPDAIKQKTQEEKQKKQKSQPKTAENKRASENAKKGFRSEAKATVMEGTISSRSKIASSNVKATPVGKYMAQISKLVEQEWQRRCMMHADLIQPGTLRIGFMVDERGKVKNINTISQTMGSENQRSLTFQALTSVKIPPMPKKVKESQGGDLLEFRYYFNFQ